MSHETEVPKRYPCRSSEARIVRSERDPRPCACADSVYLGHLGPEVAGSRATIPGQDAESGLGFTLFTLTTSASSASSDRTVRALGARHARWIAALVLVVAL